MDPDLKKEFEKIKTEDKNFNLEDFGLDLKEEFKAEDLKESGLRDVLKDDASGSISINPIAEFLEYCALCSSQKELDEAETGVGSIKNYSKTVY